MVSPNAKLHKTVLIEDEERIPAVYIMSIFIHRLRIHYVDCYSSSLKIGEIYENNSEHIIDLFENDGSKWQIT